MSELTSCNYCKFEGIKRRAKESGMKVTYKNSNVYVHPPGVKNPTNDKYFKVWFMELPKSCCC